MRGGRILIGLLAPVLAAQALAQVQSTQQGQQGVGDFYGLGDYTYFSDTTPKPTPTPTPSSAPVAKTTVTSVAEPSAAPARTTASMARTVQPAAASNAVAAEPSAQSSSSTYTYPKGDMAAARAAAKALATPARQASGGIISSTDLPSTIPGFSSGTQPGEAYADDPDALIAAGGSAAGANEAWQLVTDPGRKVVTVPAGDLTRAQDVEKDPNSYLAGQSVGGADGSCKPLPPNGTTDYYEATCNKGAKLEETPATCTGRMDPVIVDTLRYFYYGVRDQNEGNGFARNSVMQAKVSAGICRVEAGTPHIVGALGLHAAIDYVAGIGLDRIHAHETALVAATRDALARFNSVRVLGPADSAGIVSFAMEGVHPHDIGTILDEHGVAIRAGHHCAQPLMAALEVEATARASFGVYNGPDDVAALAAGMERVQRIFG
ncbi:aminotransferase class V-fold PLP-dependent enzyme [uncultured Bradyrhizobium sp.]|uniref:aminotransferase class V-fold PLP-dependent enzyme n=1 Tax=uncultured Bradyrhizobium sp. TaxID=199684 RepID=UPI00262E0BB4|nr:aminotransferase class V-fold PLP-dependent enzyme [uncultured Bradyrhizobium sp.]